MGGGWVFLKTLRGQQRENHHPSGKELSLQLPTWKAKGLRKPENDVTPAAADGTKDKRRSTDVLQLGPLMP